LCPGSFMTGQQKQQSLGWETRSKEEGSLKGYPFNEGFPTGGPFGNFNKPYELILRDGSRSMAYVSYDTQYRAEGLQWKLLDKGRLLDRCVVAAWIKV